MMNAVFSFQASFLMRMMILLLLLSSNNYKSSSSAAAAGHVSSSYFNVVRFGAKADGFTNSRDAFLSAWEAACGSTEPATIFIPKGRFLLGSAVFGGQACINKAITFLINGTLVAPLDYNVIGRRNGNWLRFDGVDGVTISGGSADGRGPSLWACKAGPSKANCPQGATSLAFYHSNNVLISRFSSLNSQQFHIVIYGSQNVRVEGVKIRATGNSPNTDGIHIQESSYVSLTASNISTGDDCVSIGPGSSHLWLENINCGPGHGISIGSLGWTMQEHGVFNVTLKNSTLSFTTNGLRIKSWARPSAGFVNDVHFENVVMSNVRNPIIIDQNYCPGGGSNCPKQASSGVNISGVTYKDIRGTSATRVAIKMDCSRDVPCTGITLEDVNLTFFNHQPALPESNCSHAAGTSAGYLQPTGCL